MKNAQPVYETPDDHLFRSKTAAVRYFRKYFGENYTVVPDGIVDMPSITTGFVTLYKIKPPE